MRQSVYTLRSSRMGKLIVLLRSLELRAVKVIMLDYMKLCFRRK